MVVQLQKGIRGHRLCTARGQFTPSAAKHFAGSWIVVKFLQQGHKGAQNLQTTTPSMPLLSTNGGHQLIHEMIVILTSHAMAMVSNALNGSLVLALYMPSSWLKNKQTNHMRSQKWSSFLQGRSQHTSCWTAYLKSGTVDGSLFTVHHNLQWNSPD
jgi:hypothetical protein